MQHPGRVAGEIADAGVDLRDSNPGKAHERRFQNGKKGKKNYRTGAAPSPRSASGASPAAT
ncbi:hypothetical protein, partial [Bordetella pertussis]|uniref:hypothetical protein n=1 Tax=Bordetella pertussis TaxID=520 RepID=UPI001C9E5A36